MTTPETRRALLGLGTNLGDRRRYLLDAVAELHDLRAVSPLYETEPVGGPDQGAFYNVVVELATSDSPRELLERCRRLEADAGRVRIERWGPRTLDVDILWIDGENVDDPDLVIPHPRAHLRNFVMQPLLDVAPDLAETFTAMGHDPEVAVGEVTKVGPL